MATIATPALRPERQIGPALRHGLRQRCPSCGEGRLFTSYLKVVDECAACGEALHHHRADDIPAYFTILIVAHMIGLALPLGFGHLASAPVTFAIILCAAATAAVLLLLPRIKGVVVGLQWAKRMDGFGPPAA